MRRLAARYVCTSATEVLAPGVIEWDATGHLVSVRRARGPVEDIAVLPGLVNAHAHLQLRPLAEAPRRFLPWVRAVIADRAECSNEDLRQQATRSLRTLLSSGCTAVAEIDSTGRSPAAWRRSSMAGRCYRELVGFDVSGARARQLVAAAHAPDRAGLAFGLSPHAPYSVSADLFRAAAARTRRLTIHCAELPEEQQLLRTGRGPFADLLRGLGRMPEDFRAPGVGAVRWLERLGVLARRPLLAHCQELERGDAARIASSGSAIVVCPGTIDFFRRAAPPVERWLARGIPVALGTDSLASNDGGLSMRTELRRAAELWPGLRPAQLLAMATETGARAIGGPFGRLARGRRADFVTVAARGSWAATLDDFVRDELPLRSVVLAGRRRRVPVDR